MRLFADVAPLRYDRSFRTLWLGQIGSAMGRETARVAVPLQVYLITGSASAIAVVAASQLVGGVLLSPVGGLLADVADRRRVLLASHVGMLTCSALLAVGASSAEPSIEVVALLALLLAAMQPIEQPARVALVARLVPRKRLTSALALTSLNFQASSIIGPAVAGLLIAAVDVGAAYVLQAACYAWALVITMRLRGQPRVSVPAGFSVWERLISGVAFIRKRPVVASTFALDLNAMVFGLPIALIPVLAVDILGMGPGGAGLLAAARGAGALGAALVSGWMSTIRRPGRVALVAVGIFSGATSLLAIDGIATAAAMLLLAACGAADLISAVMRNSIVQATAPDALRGRVSAVHGLVTASGPRIGDVRAALMADALGAPVALAAGGLLALLGTAAIARLFPSLGGYVASSTPSVR